MQCTQLSTKTAIYNRLNVTRDDELLQSMAGKTKTCNQQSPLMKVHIFHVFAKITLAENSVTRAAVDVKMATQDSRLMSQKQRQRFEGFTATLTDYTLI